MKIKLHGYSKRVNNDYKYMYVRLYITKNKWYDSHGTCMQSGLQNLNTCEDIHTNYDNNNNK